ncbi:MAG: SHOCT domain-containing protein [Nitrospinota bacterium]|jgi:putative membrane protein|nr:SHOCT domain-containing protein [Nitrospinota bacterium]
MRKFFSPWIFGAAISFPAAAPAWAQARGWEFGAGGGPWGMHYMWGAMGVGMWLFMILFWILIVVGIVALIRWLMVPQRPSQGAAGGPEAAEEILKRRYARGEIEKAEFEAKLRDLRA